MSNQKNSEIGRVSGLLLKLM